MQVNVAIPDDYQQAAGALPCFRDTPGYAITALGDLTRDPRAAGVLAQAEALILIRERTHIDTAFLRQAPNLRLISQTGKLAGHIDLAACSAVGVCVVEGTGSPVAPAELTWLLIMAARRQLVAAVDGVRAGQWQTAIGQALCGQTLGILGYGKIGKRIAAYGQVFGMRVQAWGSPRAQDEARAAGLTVPDNRQAFFASSDIVSVHQRLVEATRGNITADDLAAMQSRALFVNTSRAELVAPDALLTALRQGRPGQAAIDVFEHEPVYDRNHPLLSLPNVLCTPHIGYVEQDSYQLYFGTAFDNLRRFFLGDTSQVLNPEALRVR